MPAKVRFMSLAGPLSYSTTELIWPQRVRHKSTMVRYVSLMRPVLSSSMSWPARNRRVQLHFSEDRGLGEALATSAAELNWLQRMELKSTH